MSIIIFLYFYLYFNYFYIFIYIFSIGGVYRRKAVVRDWFGNGEQVSLRGKLELLQQTEYDITNVEVSLEGLDGKMSGYHIYMVIIA